MGIVMRAREAGILATGEETDSRDFLHREVWEVIWDCAICTLAGLINREPVKNVNTSFLTL